VKESSFERLRVVCFVVKVATTHRHFERDLLIRFHRNLILSTVDGWITNYRYFLSIRK
jgi:hypothetical protein